MNVGFVVVNIGRARRAGETRGKPADQHNAANNGSHWVLLEKLLLRSWNSSAKRSSIPRLVPDAAGRRNGLRIRATTVF
jgi:hypothetical protein